MPLRATSNGRHGRSRDERQRVEAEQHAAAQRVDAADDRGIGEAESQQPLGVREHFGARGAGGRDRDARPVEREGLGEKCAERMWHVHARAPEVRREPAVGAEARVGLLGGADARGGGADDERDARGAVARARRRDRVQEAVGPRPEPGEPVVAAVPARVLRRQPHRLDAVDPSDPGGERLRREIVRPEAAAVRGERRGERVVADADGGGRGERGDRERRHAGRWACTWAVSARSEAKMLRFSGSSERSCTP